MKKLVLLSLLGLVFVACGPTPMPRVLDVLPTDTPVRFATPTATPIPLRPTQPALEVTPTDTPPSPTFTPFPTSTPQPTPTLPAQITIGGYVKVLGSEADQLSYRSGPGLNYTRRRLLHDGTILKVLDGPEQANDLTWWRLEGEEGDIGWAADKWLEPTIPPN